MGLTSFAIDHPLLTDFELFGELALGRSINNSALAGWRVTLTDGNSGRAIDSRAGEKSPLHPICDRGISGKRRFQHSQESLSQSRWPPNMHTCQDVGSPTCTLTPLRGDLRAVQGRPQKPWTTLCLWSTSRWRLSSEQGGKGACERERRDGKIVALSGRPCLLWACHPLPGLSPLGEARDQQCHRPGTPHQWLKALVQRWAAQMLGRRIWLKWTCPRICFMFQPSLNSHKWTTP